MSSTCVRHRRRLRLRHLLAVALVAILGASQAEDSFARTRSRHALSTARASARGGRHRKPAARRRHAVRRGGQHAGGPSRYLPLTPWHKPPVRLPGPQRLQYTPLAAAGIAGASRWRRGGWYCEYLGCPGRYPLATIWGSVPLFEAADALQLSEPSGAHRALVRRFARASERFWNSALRGYAPYPNDRSPSVEVWFDDNGWMGLAFLNAYEGTRVRRYLHDAQRAFQFISKNGWDEAGGGGMWWNTDHPYHSGPALASDSLLGILLYNIDHQRWQLEDVEKYVQWGNLHDVSDERRLYLEKPNEPSSVIDYVQGPLIYAQYLLCKDGAGRSFCVRAGRTAATMAEQHANAYGYRLNYGPEYDAIYLQWMMAYGRAIHSDYWLRFAQLNAAAAAAHAGDSEGLLLSSWWGGPIVDPETHADMLRTAAATTSLFAWVGYYSALPPGGPATVAAWQPAAPHVSAGHHGGASDRRGRTRAHGRAVSGVGVRAAGRLGRILDDLAGGRTVYMFMADRHGRSACTGACEGIWPPLRASGSIRARGGASRGRLGSIARSHGVRQLTYAGHPLYLYAGDSRPGQTRGQALKSFGARWYVVSVAGAPVKR